MAISLQLLFSVIQFNSKNQYSTKNSEQNEKKSISWYYHDRHRNFSNAVRFIIETLSYFLFTAVNYVHTNSCQCISYFYKNLHFTYRKLNKYFWREKVVQKTRSFAEIELIWFFTLPHMQPSFKLQISKFRPEKHNFRIELNFFYFFFFLFRMSDCLPPHQNLEDKYS